MNRDCNCILTRPLQPSPTRDPQANVSWEDGKTQPPGAIDGIGPDKFVEFFRQASPYIVNHHGSVMVVVIPGEVFIAKDVLQGIVQDVALLQSLGVRVVLVLGSNKQVEEGLVDRGIGSEVVDGYRVTSPEALEVAMEAAGRNSVLVLCPIPKYRPDCSARFESCRHSLGKS